MIFLSKTCVLILGVFSLGIFDSSSFVNHDRNKGNKPVEAAIVDDALFLTPYIDKGQIKEGQTLAVVPPMLESIESFAGYLTVNKTTNSNLFFWLFKSQLGDWEEQPLVVWLQGGPGVSSLLGLFAEVGPFTVTSILTIFQTLKRRKDSWNLKYNLIFVDSPVGAGFSYTERDSGYPRNENDVARDLYEAFVQLYKLFPSLQKNSLIITGESYAGKFGPAFAYKIYKANKVSTFKINVAGLMIGSAFTDPISMSSYASYLYNLGLIDKKKETQLIVEEDEIRANIRAGKYLDAYGGRVDEVKHFLSVTGLKSEFDFIHDDMIDSLGIGVLEFLNNTDTRRAIHVGNHQFDILSLEANGHLRCDIMQSVKPWVEELLTAEEFPVLFYNGQLDIVDAYPLSVEFYDSLQWPRVKDYHEANRCQFIVDGEVAGYYKSAGTFIEVLVRNAGHMVPIDQPKWVYELLDRFITNSTFFVCDKVPNF